MARLVRIGATTTAGFERYLGWEVIQHGDASRCARLGRRPGRGCCPDRAGVWTARAAAAGAGLSTGLAGAGGAQERLAVGRSGGRCDPRWGAGLPEPGEWDADAVRDDLQAYVVQHLGDADGVAILDG